MTIFQSTYLIIRYEASQNAIIEEWQLDFATITRGEILQQPLLKLLDAITETKASKWICDTTEQKNVITSDQLWLEKTFYPEIFKRGIKKIAFVNEKNILLTNNAKNILNSLSNKEIEVEVFNRNQKAKDWL